MPRPTASSAPCWSASTAAAISSMSAASARAIGAGKVDVLLPKLRALETAKSPFTGIGAPKKDPNVVWVKPELVAEIEFAGWTADGLVRQAAFKGLREDKPAGEVVAEKPVEPAEAETPDPERQAETPKRFGEACRARAARQDVMGVLISNPDKPLWPDASDGEPVTKVELARLLRGRRPLADRPYQRPAVLDHPNPRWHRRRAVFPAACDAGHIQSSGTGAGLRRQKPYLQIDRVEGLAAIAQIGGVELHPWNCEPKLPEVPGRLVFDLDPGPDVPFSTVVEAAREMRDRLEELGLVSFCKTTGGKGLHVVTPLAVAKGKKLAWPEAKGFAHDVCLQMARENPELYLIKMAKNQRSGRIFLDYLRNDRMATAVAPLSPRARPGATVSMPLTWNQVKADLDPKRFTVRTVPALLAKTSAWQDYCDGQRSLEQAIKRLAKSMKQAA